MQHDFHPQKKGHPYRFHFCSCGGWFGSPWWSRHYARIMHRQHACQAPA